MQCCGCKQNSYEDMILAPKKKTKYWWHIECYKKSKYYDELMFESYLEESLNIINLKKEEKDLYDYFKDKYDFPMSNREYQKLADIKNGNFKTKEYPRGISPISFSELLYMFKKMEIFLSKISIKFNTTKDKFNYHLSVVFNKYPSYLEHKKNQERIVVPKLKEIPTEILNKKKEENNKSFNVEDFLF